MGKLVFLGTSNAISNENHENTHLCLVGERRTILIDCPNNPIQRFEKAGVDPFRLTDIVLTHFHPDHVSGVPQLLMNLWLMGRKEPMKIHGLAYTIDRTEKLMELYSSSEWPGFYRIGYERIPDQNMAPVITDNDFEIVSTPVKHFIPTIGLRFEFPKSKKNIAYSCDTEPTAQVVELARNVDILIHEASGAVPGHTSASQAGEIAKEAGAKHLYLIHYPTGKFATDSIVDEAKETFDGPVTKVEDYMVIEF
jgi:ribonuclease Z